MTDRISDTGPAARDRDDIPDAPCWFCHREVPYDSLIPGYDTWDEQRLACHRCNEAIRWLNDHGLVVSRTSAPDPAPVREAALRTAIEMRWESTPDPETLVRWLDSAIGHADEFRVVQVKVHADMLRLTRDYIRAALAVRPAPSGDADAAWEALRRDVARGATFTRANLITEAIARHRSLIEAALRAVAPSDGALRTALEAAIESWVAEFGPPGYPRTEPEWMVRARAALATLTSLVDANQGSESGSKRQLIAAPSDGADASEPEAGS